MAYSQAEKLQIMMLCEIYRKLDIKDSFDPGLIEEAVSSDNYWAINWEYPSLDDGEDDPLKVKVFADTVDMYEILQFTYERFTDTEKAEVASKISHFDESYSLSFPGFDGNNEGEFIGVGRLLKKMGRFSESIDLTKNSHRRSVDIYQRMLEEFLPARANDWHDGKGISVESFIKTFNARTHPSNR